MLKFGLGNTKSTWTELQNRKIRNLGMFSMLGAITGDIVGSPHRVASFDRNRWLAFLSRN